MTSSQTTGSTAPLVHHVPTRLGSLAVHEYPSKKPGRGTALLWHSIFTDSRSWFSAAPALAQYRRLLIVDGPGCGASSELTRATSIGQGAEAASEMLDHLGAGPVDWVGNAWGGHTGLHLAATAPERIRSLVAISTPVAALAQRDRRQIDMLARALRVVGPVRPLRDAVAGVQLVDPHGAARPVLDAGMRTPSRRSLAKAVESFVVRRSDLSWALPRITTPTLIVATDKRADYTPAMAEATAHAVPRGLSAVIPGAAVLAPLEQPAITADVVADFWNSLPAPR